MTLNHWYRSPATLAVRRELLRWRDDHGYQPGQTWNPYRAAYAWPERTCRACGQPIANARPGQDEHALCSGEAEA